ncbi:OLC1v1032541C1 [Oldenlandia corymbosa var. corymbosa]|uniref:OLC1v1032541C1 n=1 Tax=Oldenlandia corymbosa var. corymbosa TaxID=529605 RepID=A0AAV1CMT7_OLDCO|nr:OLC1v1032541C1 [Oldenlandia corymbosa var. corymbosa]
MVEFRKLIHLVLILVIVAGLLSDAYTRQIGGSSRGCNAVSNQGFETLPRGSSQEQGEMKSKQGGESEATVKRSLKSQQKTVARYRDFTSDYDRGPMHHPPKNN